jgi:hypothetical protein
MIQNPHPALPILCNPAKCAAYNYMINAAFTLKPPVSEFKGTKKSAAVTPREFSLVVRGYC